MVCQLVVGVQDSVLVQKAAHAFHADLIPITINRFSDSESKLTIQQAEKVAGASVVLFFQIFSPLEQKRAVNDQLFDLLLIIQLLKQRQAKKISLVMPYFPYARQEKENNGQTMSTAKLFGNLLQLAGVDELFVCDIHSPTIASVIPVPVHNIALTALWSKVCEGFEKQSCCLVSPDFGGRDRVQALEQVTGYSSAFIKKTRTNGGGAIALELVGDVAGKTVILVDDIVDTAQTAVSASELLFKHGAQKLIGCFSHAILSGPAYQNLMNSRFEQIFLTDSVVFDSTKLSKKFSVVSMHEFLLRQLSRV